MATSAPKWSAIEQDERFQALDYEQKLKVREAHFQRTIAPHVRNEADLSTAWQRFSEAAFIDNDVSYLGKMRGRISASHQEQAGGILTSASRELREPQTFLGRVREEFEETKMRPTEGFLDTAGEFARAAGEAVTLPFDVAIKAPVEEAAQGAIEMAGETGQSALEEMETIGEGMYERGQQTREKAGEFGIARPEGFEPLQAVGYYGTQALESLGTNMGPSMAVGLLTRKRTESVNRVLKSKGIKTIDTDAMTQISGLGLMGTQIFGQEYETAYQENGGDHAAAMEAGTVRMFAEVVPEIIPFGFAMKTAGPLAKAMMKMGGVKGVAAQLTGGILSEGGSEVLTEIINETYNTLGLGEELDYETFKTQMFDAFMVGALMGGVMNVPASIQRYSQPDLPQADPGVMTDENPSGGGVNLKSGEFNYSETGTTPITAEQPVSLETVDLNQPIQYVEGEDGQRLDPLDLDQPIPAEEIPESGTIMPESGIPEDNIDVIEPGAEDNIDVIIPEEDIEGVVDPDSVPLDDAAAVELFDEAERLEAEALAEEAAPARKTIQEVEDDAEFITWLDEEVAPMEEKLKEMRGETAAQKKAAANKRAAMGSGEQKTALAQQEPHPARDNLLTLIAKGGGLHSGLWEAEHGVDVAGERRKGGSNWIAGGSRQLWSEYKTAMSPDALAEWINQSGPGAYSIPDQYLDVNGQVDANTVGALVADMIQDPDMVGTPEFVEAQGQAELIERAREAYESQWRTIQGVRAGDLETLAEMEREELPDATYTQEEYEAAATEEEAIPAEGAEYEAEADLVDDLVPESEKGEKEFVPGVTSYRSGASALADLRGYEKTNTPAGVVVDKLYEPAKILLAKMAKAGQKVFVDSGAYGAFKRGTPIKLGSFLKILDKYDDLIERAGEGSRNMTFVMPDVIGDYETTTRLQKQTQARIRAIAGKANIIFPVQKSNTQSIEEIAAELGGDAGAVGLLESIAGNPDFYIGIPANQEAFSSEDLYTFMQNWEGTPPAGVHFLGIAKQTKKLTMLRNLVKQEWPDTEVSSDANRILAQTKQIGEEAAKAKEELSEEALDQEAEFDETEQLIDSGAGWNKAQIDAAAESIGTSSEAVAKAIKAGKLTELLENLQADEKSVMVAVRAAMKAGAEKAKTGEARTEGVASTELSAEEKAAKAKKDAAEKAKADAEVATRKAEEAEAKKATIEAEKAAEEKVRAEKVAEAEKVQAEKEAEAEKVRVEAEAAKAKEEAEAAEAEEEVPPTVDLPGDTQAAIETRLQQTIDLLDVGAKGVADMALKLMKQGLLPLAIERLEQASAIAMQQQMPLSEVLDEIIDSTEALKKEQKKAAKEAVKPTKDKAAKPTKGKLKNTGADLRRHWEEMKADLEAAKSDGEKIWSTVDRNTQRARLLNFVPGKEATPGVERWYAEVSKNVYTFRKLLEGGWNLRSTRGSWSTPMAKQMKDRLDGTYDEGKTEWTPVLMDWAREYETMLALLSADLSGANTVEEAEAKLAKIIDTQRLPTSSWGKLKYLDAANVITLQNRGLTTGRERDLQKETGEVPTITLGPFENTAIRTMVKNRKNQLGDIESGMDTSPIIPWKLQNLINNQGDETDTTGRKKRMVRPRIDKIEREGKVIREGDITPKQLKKEFGFADIGFGKWVAAGKDQQHLNAAWDAFYDLAATLGIDRKAIGFYGKLHFTVGALGHGKAAAHFQVAQGHPDGGTVPVINLTNTKGDGTVSHEWGHAFDYLFFRGDSPGARAVMKRIATELRRERNIEEFRKRVMGGVTGSLVMRRSGKARSIENVQSLAEYYMSGYGAKMTQYKVNSNELGKDYWGSDVEMFARAFEAYVYDQLEANETSNNYLVSSWVAPNGTTKAEYRGTPYPQADERGKFNAIFDAMVKALTVKDGEYSIDEALFNENLPAETRDWDKLTKEIYDSIPAMVEAETAEREAQKLAREEEKQQVEKDKWKAALEEAKAKQKIEDDARRVEDEDKAAQAAADTGDVANTVDPSKPLSDTEAEQLFDQALSELQEELEGDGKDPIGEADTPEGEPTQPIPWTRETIFGTEDETDPKPPKGGKKAPTAGSLAKAVKDSGVAGLGAAAKGLAELFPANKLHSFPPTVDPDHYKKAKPHFIEALSKFQESGQDLLELVRWLIRTYGANIKPYVLFFIKDEGLSVDLKATPSIAVPKTAPGSLADLMYVNMATINNNNDLKAILAKHHGRAATELEIKAGQEAFELALVVKAREIVADGRERGQSRKAVYSRLQSMYESQPILSSRTSSSMAQQAYSTPMPLAFLASELAGINPGSSVYEPTAGNGALLIGANPVKSIVNELNSDRANNLRSIGFLANENDAATWTPSGLVDAAIMNPPFGDYGSTVQIIGYNLSKIDHIIASRALSALKDDGKATIIIGAHKDTGKVSPAQRIFLNWLYAEYNVVDHFEVNGDLYRKQGAGWPVAVITVHGRKSSNRVFDATVERLDNWDSIYEHVENILDTTGLTRGSSSSAVDTGQRAEDGAGTQAETGVLPDQVGGEAGVRAGEGIRGEDGVRDRTGTEPVSGNVNETSVSDPDTVSERPDDGGLPSTGDSKTGSKRPGQTTIVSEQPVTGAALRTQPNLTVGSDYQTAYMTASSGFNEDVLIPVNMASAVEASLTRLHAAIGDSDLYLQSKLGYKSKKALHKAFMALQVDAVASAINTIETSGRGTIIADQTGVGKGRQAAAMIRYALKNDMVPVFVTVTPNLFTDMYDDLLDINETGVKPYIFNDEGGFITDREGGPNKFRNTAKVRKEGMAALKSGKMPTGANTLFLTYSQTNNYNANQRDMLEGLKKSGKRVLYIFDESHTIAGVREKWNSKAKEMRKTRAGFFFELIEDQPVVYLSATYAKRPDNVPIYYRTDLIDAVEDVEELEAAVGAGGEGLQTVMANMLAQAGQLWRRERSFAGIEFKSVIFGRDENGVAIPEKDAERQKHIEITNQATKGLREIVAVDRLFGAFVEEEGHRLMDVLPAAEGGVISMGGTQADLALQHSLFASVVHNFVSQLLLSLKADWIVSEALEQHKAGKKPVIALHNTMESFLEAEKERGNVEMEGEWDGDYRSVLIAALERTRRITIEDKRGNKERVVVPLNLLPLGMQSRYKAAENMIMALPIEEVTLFYIDYITNKLEQGGMKVGEITGRKYIMDYSEGGNPILRNRPNRSKKFRRTIIDRFNSGATDALIINAAGSTGLSIHASENFKDQKPRHMLVAQAIPDINTLMQMFGRINRTGQTALPEYSMLGLDLPSEKRPLAMTARKMRSLNANTSANTESETSIDASEILNKYGDLVVKRVMIENPEFQVYSSYEVNDDTDAAGLATKITGKLSLAPYEIQEQAWALFMSEYQNHMEMLDSTGQNDLRVETQDLNAKIIDSKIIYEGKAPETVFGGNTTLHKVSINLQGRAPSHLDVLSSIDDFLDGRSANEVTSEILDFTKLADVDRTAAMVAATQEEIDPGDVDNAAAVAAHKEKIDKAKQTLQNHNRDKGAFEQTLKRYPVGSAWKIDIGDDVVTGTIVSVKTTHKEGGGNPFAPSKIQYRFMVNSPVRLFPIAMSGINRGTVIVNQLYVNPSNMENLYNSRAKSSRRETRYIATGNLISGYSRIGGTGKVTSFTAANGKAYTGILLPRKFGDGGEFAGSDSDPVIMRDPAETAAYLRGTRQIHDLARFGIYNLPDQDIRIVSAGTYGYNAGKWTISAPKKRTTMSQAIKFDLTLLRIMDTEFAGRGQTLEATFDDSKLDEVLKRIAEITTMYIPGSGFSALSNITGRERLEATLSFDGGPTDESLREDYADADEGGLFENTEDESPRFNLGSPFSFNQPGPAATTDPGRVTFLTKKLEAVIARHSGKSISQGTYTEVGSPASAAAAVTAVKRVFGKRVVFFRNNGGPRFNGVVLPNDAKTIYINVDSMNPFMGVLGHELLHSLRQSHPAIYDKLANLARSHLKSKGLEEFSAQHGEKLEKDKMFEEMVGNVIGDALLDPKFIRTLKSESLSFFEKLIDALTGILNLFKQKILSKGMGTTTYFNYVDTLIQQSQSILRQADVAHPVDAIPSTEAIPSDDAPTYHRPNRDYTTGQREFMEKAGMPTQREHLAGKVRGILMELRANGARMLSDAIQQGLFDKFYGIKAAYRDYLGEDATTNAAGSGYVAARLSTGAASVMRGILLYGAPVWRNGIIQRMQNTRGLLDVFSPVKAELNDYLGWMIARRAERLYSEGKENNFTLDQINEGLALAEGQMEVEGVMRDRLEVFEEVAEDFNDFKTTILDVAEGAGLIDGTTRPVWENPDWIPFYRIQDSQNPKRAKGLKGGFGLSHQTSGIKALKGGEAALSDPMGNIIMNFNHLIEASMKNMAMLKTVDDLSETEAVTKTRIPMQQALIVKTDVARMLRADGVDEATIQQLEDDGAFEGLAKMWSLARVTPPGVAKVMRDGKAEYWKINDERLLRSLLDVDLDRLHPIMGIFRAPKSLLTTMVTAEPSFMLRNFTRDALHAWVINEDHFVIGVDSVRGWVKAAKEEGGMLDMMFAGGSFQGGYINGTDPDAARKSIRVAMRAKGYDNQYIEAHLDTVIDTTAGLWDKWRKIGDGVENANREAVYEAATKAGKSTARAVYEAKDLMDFSMQGSWYAIRVLADMLPFFNARLQGLYKLGRSGAVPIPGLVVKEIMLRGAYLALFSMALAWMNSGDEDYEALEEWEKDAYWHFFPGTPAHIRIPKPFEVGILYGTIPERIYRAMSGSDTMEKFGERMWHALTDTMAMNPVPQTFKPAAEVISNKNFFTGRPIESMSDRNKMKRARYNTSTSDLMVAMGPFLESFGLSPKQAESLVRGYTGTLGNYVLMATDVVVRDIQGKPPVPAKTIRELPVVGSFIRGEGAAWNTRYGTEMYDMHREVTELWSTIKTFQKEGLLEDARELFNDPENKEVLKTRGELKSWVKARSALRKEIDRIYKHPEYSAQEKRDRIEKILVRRNKLDAKTYGYVSPLFGRK